GAVAHPRPRHPSARPRPRAAAGPRGALVAPATATGARRRWWPAGSASCQVAAAERVSVAKGEADYRLEFLERLRRRCHLDGVHPHLARRLEVDAKVVEIDTVLRRDAEGVGHHAVDARVRLAYPRLCAFDDVVEQA